MRLIRRIAQRPTCIAAGEADFTLTFRALSEDVMGEVGLGRARSLFNNAQLFDEWSALLRERLSREKRTPSERATEMRRVNPKFIRRNHWIEAAIAEAERGRFNLFEELTRALNNPFDSQPEFERYAQAPRRGEVLQTFCGT